MSTPLLSIRDLHLELLSDRGVVYALQGVNLEIQPGEIHGLVGESGCGKSMTSRSILRLHNPRRSRMRGEIRFCGEDLLTLPAGKIRQLRGNRISLIFQDPMTSLNPLLTIGDQLSEAFTVHHGMGRKQAKSEAMSLLERVGIQPPEKRMGQFPHQLSGGLQQRVMIAIAIANKPDLLIADEPTTALDVTIQAQILELLQELQRDTGMSILLITHNFGVVAEVCHRVSVMYAGRVVETTDTPTIFHRPGHPYSRALVESIPRARQDSPYLPTIPGSPPPLYDRFPQCPYAPRCPLADASCEQAPLLRPLAGDAGHLVACHHLSPAKQEGNHES